MVAGDAIVPAAAQLFRDPAPPLEALDGHWTFTWDAGLSWFEEALEVHVHARDPCKRVDAVSSERHVRVELDGEVVAESRRPHALFETTLPTRWYLPPEDVHHELLVPSDTVSRCPYKGTATYWSVRTGAGLHPDAAWSYPEPVLATVASSTVTTSATGLPVARPVAKASCLRARIGARVEPLPPLSP